MDILGAMSEWAWTFGHYELTNLTRIKGRTKDRTEEGAKEWAKEWDGAGAGWVAGEGGSWKRSGRWKLVWEQLSLFREQDLMALWWSWCLCEASPLDSDWTLTFLTMTCAWQKPKTLTLFTLILACFACVELFSFKYEYEYESWNWKSQNCHLRPMIF